MTDLGYAALLIAFVLSLYAVVTYLWGSKGGYAEIVESARNAVLVVAALVVLASAVLVYALLTHDFSLKAVFDYTSADMSPLYILSAFWAGQAGSLLLWSLLLAIFAVVVVLQNRRRNQELLPWAMAIMMVVQAFFLFLLGFVSSPFARVSTPILPTEGNGLNPLLENWGMLIHPPSLYLGYVGFTVPFAFAIAALVTRRLDSGWLHATRGWTLFAWFFLGMGNLLGAQWAYAELGWGGYWGWDPVENGSLMPWLTATAFIHSMRMQHWRGMMKVWNVGLIIATFTLTIFGTFLTRSGILSSVHSFADWGVGAFFLSFIVVTLVGSLWLLFDRLPLLREENEMQSLVSREAGFLLTNLILAATVFATFWGTMFPFISEVATGNKITVGPPFFNKVNGPILLALILLMGLGPLISWRRASGASIWRKAMYPTAVGVLTFVAAFALGARVLWATLSLAICAFVMAAVVLEWYHGTRTRQRARGENYLQALLGLALTNKPRWGGSIVHLGIAIMAVGVVASSAFAVETEQALAKGESLTIAGYTLQFQDLQPELDSPPSKDIVTATLNVSQNGQPVGQVQAKKIFHRSYENPVTEVAIRTTPWEDLYVILGGWSQDGTATFKVIVNPLVVWIWLGGGLALAGGVLAAWPEAAVRREETAREVRLGLAAATSR